MAIYLKQSTASQEVPLGYFVDSTDGNTEETGLTINNTDIKLWKAGATTLANKTSGGATHISNGIYYAVLDATDTDTLGSLVLFVHVAGALTVRLECAVLAANIYDSLIGGGDVLDVSVTQWLGTAAATPTVAGVPEVDLTHIGGAAQSATDLKDFADDGYDPATNKVQGVVLVDTLTTYTGNTPQTGDSFARLGAPAGASVSADIAAIEAQTDDIGAAGAGLTAVPWNAAWDAEVQSEVQDAIEVNRLDELLTVDSDIDGAAPPTVGSVFHELMSKTAGSFTFDQTTDSLEALQAEHDSTQSAVAALNNLSSAQAQTAAAAALTAYDPPTNAEMEARTLVAANYATASALDAVDNFVDTEVAAIKAVTDALPNAGALTTIQSDLDDIQARLPAALTGAGNMKADGLALNGSTAAAARLALSAATIVPGTAVTGTLSTTQMSSDLTEATDDHYNGRIIIWTSGALQDQATDITAYDGTTKVLTFTAVTEAPVNNDTFVIV